jgi:type VI secretion system protein ImpB
VAKTESLQKKLSRVRPPRVQIEYEVETEGSPIKRQLPFVVGVLADLAGHPDPEADPLPDLKTEDRKFVEINRDTFDKVMAGIKPRLMLRVDNKLQDDANPLGVELKFRKMEDFEPVNVVRHVEPLNKLLELREQLSEIKTKIGNNGKLERVLQQIIHSTDQLRKLARETGQLTDETASSDAPPDTTDTEGEPASGLRRKT